MATIPPDMREKEKIVGGLLDINQLLWIVGGGVLGAVMFGTSFLILQLPILSIILAIIGIALSLPFVFYKKNDLSLFLFLKYSYEFKTKVKELPNINNGKGVR